MKMRQNCKCYRDRPFFMVGFLKKKTKKKTLISVQFVALYTSNLSVEFVQESQTFQINNITLRTNYNFKRSRFAFRKLVQANILVSVSYLIFYVKLMLSLYFLVSHFSLFSDYLFCYSCFLKTFYCVYNL